jgi:hypothetical protein
MELTPERLLVRVAMRAKQASDADTIRELLRTFDAQGCEIWVNSSYSVLVKPKGIGAAGAKKVCAELVKAIKGAGINASMTRKRPVDKEWTVVFGPHA